MALGVRIRTAEATIMDGIAPVYRIKNGPQHRDRSSMKSGTRVEDEGPGKMLLSKDSLLTSWNFSVELLRFPVSAISRVM